MTAVFFLESANHINGSSSKSGKRGQIGFYLIPQQDNTTFGYTRSELKNRLVGSNASYEAYNLAMFIILVFLMSCFTESYLFCK